MAAAGCVAPIANDDHTKGLNHDSTANRAGESIEPEQWQRLQDAIAQRCPTCELQWTNIINPEFVLHDTGGATSDSYMRDQAQNGRGPLGAGPQFWLNRNGYWGNRPLYNSWRPTASKHEQGIDLLNYDSQAISRLGRGLWDRASNEAREASLDAVFHQLRDVLGEDVLNAHEIEAQRTAAGRQLNSSTGRIMTTATWAVEQLLEDDTSLEFEESERLAEVMRRRRGRMSRRVHAEIGNASDAECNANTFVGSYDEAVYSLLTELYLRAAYSAGHFPAITTHFVTDAAFEDPHCDPRCFDLTRLYREIATAVGDPAGTRYGEVPSYGTQLGTNNVWWNDSACGGPPPDAVAL